MSRLRLCELRVLKYYVDNKALFETQICNSCIGKPVCVDWNNSRFLCDSAITLWSASGFIQKNTVCILYVLCRFALSFVPLWVGTGTDHFTHISFSATLVHFWCEAIILWHNISEATLKDIGKQLALIFVVATGTKFRMFIVIDRFRIAFACLLTGGGH